MKLQDKTCRQAARTKLSSEDLDLLAHETPEWEIKDSDMMIRSVSFARYRDALATVIQIAELAEQENHHPRVLLEWGKIEISLWTHTANGLTEADFILAAKIDSIIELTRRN